MRLLRLTSREPTALFDAAFQANIDLPPNSRIALQSVSIDSIGKSVIVNGFNNEIRYGIAEGVERVAIIPNGEYSLSDLNRWNNTLTSSLNASCDFKSTDISNKMLGTEWLVRKNSRGLEAVGYRNAVAGLYRSSWDLSGVNMASTGTTKSSEATDVSDNSVNMKFPHIIARGNGYSRARTATLDFGTDAEDTGYIWGVTSNPTINQDDIDLTKVDLAIQVTATSGTDRIYRVLKAGVQVGSDVSMNSYTVNSVQNEQVELAVNGPNLEANVYRSDGTKETLHSEPIQLSPDLAIRSDAFAPVCVIRGGNTKTIINAIRVTPSPWEPEPTLSTGENEENLGAPPIQRSPPVATAQNFIQFEGAQVASFMGFKNQRIPAVSGFILAAQHTYTADFTLATPQEADAYIVELLNLKLDSYDSFSTAETPEGGGRRSILHVIPTSNDRGQVIYAPPYLTFLDLNNRETIYLRNLRARVVHNDYSDIETRGLSTLVLIVDN
jgi:hypothetical protein